MADLSTERKCTCSTPGGDVPHHPWCPAVYSGVIPQTFDVVISAQSTVAMAGGACTVPTFGPEDLSKLRTELATARQELREAVGLLRTQVNADARDDCTCFHCLATRFTKSFDAKEGKCSHQWATVDDDCLSEDRTSVVCVKCKVPGERNNKTGDVFWPAT